MQADFERDGDEELRRSVRFLADLAPDLSADEHLKALARRTTLQREWWRFLDRVPLVLAPVSAAPPYAAGFDVESPERTRRIWAECSTMMAVPVLGLPAVAVPTGVVDGLPAGVQIVGPRFREDACLDAAAAIEARSGMVGRTPIDPA